MSFQEGLLGHFWAQSGRDVLQEEAARDRGEAGRRTYILQEFC